MIKAQNITRQYGAVTAVDRVSFTIDSGEIVGLLGPNGAGKSTIMKMLTGFMEPTDGSVLIDGTDVTTHRVRVQKEIGYLPENCPVYPEMTVIDYLEYAAGLHGVDAASIQTAVRRAIASTELQQNASRPISTLSRGFRQRVGVAQAILHNPRVLILDEPTNGLDPSQIKHMRDLITELGRKSTLVISTHILQEVEAVCDRVLILRAGRLVLDSSLDLLRRSRRLLVSVDHGPEAVCGGLAALQGVTGVDYISGDAGRYNYVLNTDLDDEAQRCDMAARVARASIDLGFKLYALHQETRDLETVFREVNTLDAISEGGPVRAI